MTLRTFLFNVSPDGTVLNTSNIVATDGTPANLVNSGSGNTTTSSSVQSSQGGFSLRWTGAGTASGETRLPFVNADTKGAFSIKRFIGAAANMVPFVVRSSSGHIFRIGLSGTNKLQIQSSTGSVLATSPETVVENQWNRFDVVFDTVAGTVTAKTFTGDASGAADATATLTGGSFASAVATLVALGSPTVALATSIYYDTAQLNDGATTAPGPYSAGNNPPVLTLPGNQNVAAGATVTVAASAIDPDGTIASYAWTATDYSDTAATSFTSSLSGASTPTVSFTAPPAGHVVVLTCVVTDDDGATDTETTEVRVPLTGAAVALAGAGVGGAWTNVGGAATEGAALADSSDSTYVESPTLSGTATVRRFRLQPMTSRTALTLTSRAMHTVTGGTAKVRLYEGATQRQEWDVTQATSFGDQTLTVTAPEAIADWGNLRVEYSVAS